MKLIAEISGVDESKSYLAMAPKKLALAQSRARSRALTAARQENIRQVRETYDAKSGGLRAGMQIDSIEGTLSIRGKPQKLIDFKVSPKKPQRGMVRASVKKSGNKAITYAFIARMPNGHVGVFAREYPSAPREKIKQLYTVSAAQMGGEPKVLDKTIKRALEVYKSRLDHEVEFILGD